MIDSLMLVLTFFLFLILGRYLYHRMLEKLSFITVTILVYTIGVWSGKNIFLNIFSIFLSVFMYLFCLLATTLIVGVVIHRRFSIANNGVYSISNTIVIAVFLGWVTSIFIPIHIFSLLGLFIRIELYILIALVALSSSRYIDKRILVSNGRDALKAVIEALINGLLTGLIFWILTGVDLRVSIAIALGMGWYSFTGPFISLHAGPIMGMLAFLVNLLREQLAFIIVPLIKEPRLSLLGLGGATTMDNTLLVYSMVHGKEFSVTALIHGAIHTLLVPTVLTILFVL